MNLRTRQGAVSSARRSRNQTLEKHPTSNTHWTTCRVPFDVEVVGCSRSCRRKIYAKRTDFRLYVFTAPWPGGLDTARLTLRFWENLLSLLPRIGTMKRDPAMPTRFGVPPSGGLDRPKPELRVISMTVRPMFWHRSESQPWRSIPVSGSGRDS